jgi:glycosyltransferase involved in cell wall biosynthesis
MNMNRLIAHKINRPARKKGHAYNILCFPTHESYQTLLSYTGHNFYMLRGKKEWETDYRPLPPNYYPIDKVDDSLNIDFCLSQDRFYQVQFLKEMSEKIRCPLIHCEHVEPQLKDGRWTQEEFEKLRAISGHLNVYISEHNKGSWGDEGGLVIPHGIEMDKFKGWTGSDGFVLYVCNYLADRDYFCGFKEWSYIKERVESKRPGTRFLVIGSGSPLGHPANDLNHLISLYQRCGCYLNTSQLSPIPMSLLEAMSTGCPVISTAKQDCPNVIQDGKNGYCSNKLDTLCKNIIYCLDNQNEAKELGDSARSTIATNFSLTGFVEGWNKVFDQAYDMRIGT